MTVDIASVNPQQVGANEFAPQFGQEKKQKIHGLKKLLFHGMPNDRSLMARHKCTDDA